MSMKKKAQPTVALEDVRAALSQVKDPDLGRDIVTLGFISLDSACGCG